MADEHDEQFETADSGASKTYPMAAGQVRKGGHVVINGFPCKVVETSTSKTGKHGHAKVSIVGIDVFTGKKYETMAPSTHNVDAPNVSKAQYTLVDMEGNMATLMNDKGEQREDLDIPDDLMPEAQKFFDEEGMASIETTSAMGTTKITAVKRPSPE